MSEDLNLPPREAGAAAFRDGKGIHEAPWTVCVPTTGGRWVSTPGGVAIPDPNWRDGWLNALAEEVGRIGAAVEALEWNLQ